MNKRIITDLALRVLGPTSGGLTYFLIAHYVFNYEKARVFGILIAVIPISFLIVQYFWRQEWKR
jgi:hypothetical protein